MKSFLKELFFRIVPTQRLSQERAVILMYHSLDTRTDSFVFVSPEQFEMQLAYIKRKHLSVVPLAHVQQRLIEKKQLGGSVVITFDDGYEDNIRIALPLLEKYAIPATIFITTGLIGSKDAQGLEYLSEEDIRILDAHPLISLAPHTRTHPRLAQLPSDESRNEIHGSKIDLDALLTQPSKYFAYPYGSYGSETSVLVRDGGFLAAVTVQEGTVGPDADLYVLPRNAIDWTTTPAQFAGKLSRASDWYRWFKKLL